LTTVTEPPFHTVCILYDIPVIKQFINVNLYQWNALV
jgi:hypothetical protein